MGTLAETMALAKDLDARVRKIETQAARWRDALTWIERNVPDGFAIVARALSAASKGADDGLR